MSAASREDAKYDPTEIIGLDAYSQDNQFIGRVSSLLPVASDSEQRVEEGHTDVVGPDGRLLGKRHLVVNGTGTIIQAVIVVTIDALTVDLRGRRVIVPLTIPQIEAMPRHDPMRG